MSSDKTKKSIKVYDTTVSGPWEPDSVIFRAYCYIIAIFLSELLSFVLFPFIIIARFDFQCLQ